MGTDYFDALSIHDPRDIDPTLEKDGTLSGLLKLKDRGLARNLGYAMNPHPFHLKAIETGELDVLLTFNDFNLFGQTAAEQIIPAAAERDIGVLNGWSIKRGLLTGNVRLACWPLLCSFVCGISGYTVTPSVVSIASS